MTQKIQAGSSLGDRVDRLTKPAGGSVAVVCNGDISDAAKSNKGSLGFVPTMGALHVGHASLIRAAAQQCDEVCVSIFVNPAQFAVGEDFDRYPRMIDADVELARDAGANYIFTPNLEQIYPDYPRLQAFCNRKGQRVATGLTAGTVPGPLAKDWEGKHRPDHFEGVCAVVMRLFELVQPTHAYFGEKDFQQVRVIEAMVQALQLPVHIVRCQTMRDENGLALSSRNRYLSPKEYQSALSIVRALQVGDAGELDPCIDLDYFVLVDEDSLELASDFSAKQRILFAGHIGSTRLIDNAPV